MLTVGLVVAGVAGALGAVAIAVVLMIAIYAGGHISGGHYNPSVTLAATLRGALAPKQVAAYMVAQVAGAAAAVGALQVLVKPEVLGAISPIDYSAVAAVGLAEFLFTFLLAWVVLNVATAKSTSGNSNYGFAIGGAVLVGAIAVGGISGGIFNPAVLVGLLLLGKVSVASCWIPLVAQLAGGAAAAAVFKVTACDKSTCGDKA
jgi:aquaporin Z